MMTVEDQQQYDKYSDFFYMVNRRQPDVDSEQLDVATCERPYSNVDMM